MGSGSPAEPAPDLIRGGRPERRRRTSVGLRGGLEHLSARLAHSGRRGIGKQPGIIENGAELVAIAEAANRGIGAVGVHAREFAALAGAGADLLDGAYDLPVLRIERRGFSHAQGQVRGADATPGEAVDRHDLLEIRQRLTGLHNGEQQDLLIGVLPVIGAAIEHRAIGAETARAARWIAAYVHQRLGLCLGIDHRTDDAVGAGIQQLRGEDRLVPGNADHGNRRRRRDRLEHADRGRVIDRAVLQIDGDAVETLMRHDLRRIGIGERQPAVEHGAAAGESFSQLVFPHSLLPSRSDASHDARTASFGFVDAERVINPRRHDDNDPWLLAPPRAGAEPPGTLPSCRAEKSNREERMKVAKLETLRCGAGWRNYNFLKLSTDEGIVGWSEFDEGFGSPGVGTVIEQLAGRVVGRPVSAHEHIHAELYCATRPDAGGVVTEAMGAIENALLDAKAKALALPSFELLGGKLRDRSRLY